MKRSNIIYTLFVLLASTSAFAQNNYTLGDCINIGMDRNFDVQIQKNKLKMAEISASVGNSDFLPTLSLDASHSSNWDATDVTSHDDVTTHTDAYYTGSSSVGIYLNWTIFNGMNNSANFQRFKAQMQLQDIRTTIAVEDYILSMAQEYYQYIALRQQLNVQKQILELSKERVRIAKIQYETGAKSNIEYLQAKVDYNNDSTVFVRTRQTLDLQRVTLNDLMMLDDLNANNWQIADDEIVCDNNITYDELWNTCLNKNTSLLLSQKQSDIADFDIKTSRSKFYPTLNFSGGYGYRFNVASAGSYKTRNVSDPNLSLNFSLPIISGKNMQSLKNAKLAKLNYELEQKDIERQLKLEFTNNWIQFQDNLTVLELEKSNVRNSKASLDAATLQYKQSQISGLQLREAQNSYLQDQFDLLEMNLNAKLREVYLIYLAGNSTSLY